MDPAQSPADPVGTWDISVHPEWTTALPTLSSVTTVLALPLHSNRATMLVVEVLLERAGSTGYKTSFVVEWQGAQTIHLRLSSFESVSSPTAKTLQDEPGAPDPAVPPPLQMTTLRLRALEATFPGTVLQIGRPVALDDMPLIPINAEEWLLEDFTATRFWDPAEWKRGERCTLPPEVSGLKKIWFFAELWFRGAPSKHGAAPARVSYTRTCSRDISAFQALTVSVSTDRRVRFSLILRIDGRHVALIDARPGAGDGEEIRVPLSGTRLEAITVEIEEAPEAAGKSVGQTISTMVRWLLVERRGADPATANEVRGHPAFGVHQGHETLEQSGLPVGILFGREDIGPLRQKVKTEPARRIFEEILAEAESHLDYSPEPHVGRYVPIDYGNSQGAGRMSAPMKEMRSWDSCMVSSALVYVLTGRTEHADAARRALFATLACDEWASGFVSRIPVGLPGYRAPFVTASTACAVALCYDMIHPLLTPAERRAVEDALYEKAIPWLDLYLRLYGEGYLLESNQGPVFSRGLIYAALVAGRSHPDIYPLLDRWITWFWRMLTVCYERDGSTNEGPSYWEYTTHETVAALLAIARHKGKSVAELTPPNLARSMDYILHMRSLATPTLSFLNIGDCAVAESLHLSGILLFFARHLDNADAQWLWNTAYAPRRHPPGDDYFGLVLGPYLADPLLTLLHCDQGDPQTPRLEPTRRFEVCDRVFWRTGAGYGDTLLFFEGGPMIPGHAHPDKGQFLIEAHGERLVADAGMVHYADPASGSLQASSCHNVITFGGADQTYKDLKRAVVIEAMEDTPRHSYLRADLSNCYQQADRYRRHLLFARPDWFLVVDDLEAHAGEIEWHLHSVGSLTVQGSNIVAEAPRAGLVICADASHALSARTDVYNGSEGILTHNLTLAPPQETRTLRLAALIAPYRRGPGEQVPQIRCEPGLASGTGTRFVVTGGWGTDEVRLVAQRGGWKIEVTRGGEVRFQIEA